MAARSHTPLVGTLGGSIFFGLVVSGYASYLREKGKQDDLIRRAEVKRAEDYLAKRNDRPKDEEP